MRPLLDALLSVLLAVVFFVGGGVLWYYYEDAMRLFFLCLGIVGILSFCLGMAMIASGGVRRDGR
jgi:hypothetical protein